MPEALEPGVGWCPTWEVWGFHCDLHSGYSGLRGTLSECTFILHLDQGKILLKNTLVNNGSTLQEGDNTEQLEWDLLLEIQLYETSWFQSSHFIVEDT